MRKFKNLTANHLNNTNVSEYLTSKREFYYDTLVQFQLNFRTVTNVKHPHLRPETLNLAKEKAAVKVGPHSNMKPHSRLLIK